MADKSGKTVRKWKGKRPPKKTALPAPPCSCAASGITSNTNLNPRKEGADSSTPKQQVATNKQWRIPRVKAPDAGNSSEHASAASVRKVPPAQDAADQPLTFSTTTPNIKRPRSRDSSCSSQRSVGVRHQRRLSTANKATQIPEAKPRDAAVWCAPTSYHGLKLYSAKRDWKKQFMGKTGEVHVQFGFWDSHGPLTPCCGMPRVKVPPEINLIDSPVPSASEISPLLQPQREPVVLNTPSEITASFGQDKVTPDFDMIDLEEDLGPIPPVSGKDDLTLEEAGKMLEGLL